MKNTPSNRAFTLVELLVVVFILAMLMAILIPTLAPSRESARQTKCAMHLKSAVTWLNADYEKYPYDLPEELWAYCPSDPKIGGDTILPPRVYRSYQYLADPRAFVSDFSTIVLTDFSTFHSDGKNWVFGDSTVVYQKGDDAPSR